MPNHSKYTKISHMLKKLRWISTGLICRNFCTKKVTKHQLRPSKMPPLIKSKHGTARNKNFSERTLWWTTRSRKSHCRTRRLSSTKNLANFAKTWERKTELWLSASTAKCRRSLKIQQYSIVYTGCRNPLYIMHTSQLALISISSSASPTKVVSTTRKMPMSSMCHPRGAKSLASSK